MSDVVCPKCREPWESFGITHSIGEGDLTREEVAKFRKGEGCPACGFGKVCYTCHGGKIKKNGCLVCLGSGYVYAHILVIDLGVFPWRYGYSKPTKAIANPVHLTPKENWERQETGDGAAYGAKIVCPACEGKGEPCRDCHGDGKFHAEAEGDAEDNRAAFMGSMLDASDEEPVGLLDEMGGLG